MCMRTEDMEVGFVHAVGRGVFRRGVDCGRGCSSGGKSGAVDWKRGWSRLPGARSRLCRTVVGRQRALTGAGRIEEDDDEEEEERDWIVEEHDALAMKEEDEADDVEVDVDDVRVGDVESGHHEDGHEDPHGRVERRGFIGCPECGVVYAVSAAEIEPVGGEPRIVECSLCLHMWFVDESDLLGETKAVDDDAANRVAARSRKRRCAQLIPSDPSTLRATNLSPRTTSGILKKVFGAYGRVLRCELIPAMGPQERLSGLIEMASEDQAKEAIAGLDETNVFGSKMMVEMAEASAFSEVPALELSLFDDYGDMEDFVDVLDDEMEATYDDIDVDPLPRKSPYPSRPSYPPSNPARDSPGRFSQRIAASSKHPSGQKRFPRNPRTSSFMRRGYRPHNRNYLDDDNEQSDPPRDN